MPTGNFDLGDEYIINVDGEHEYHFYVLSTEGDKVNLIMNRNICSDGTLATEDKPCTVMWSTPEDTENLPNPYGYMHSSVHGPITAMNYLYEATKNWNNIPNINVDYFDGCCYNGIKTIGSRTVITMNDGTEIASYENLKSRLINRSEIKYDENNKILRYFTNGLTSYQEVYPVGTKEDIDGIDGYWSSNSDVATSAYGDFCNISLGTYYEGFMNDRGNLGVRPIIEVSKSSLD